MAKEKDTQLRRGLPPPAYQHCRIEVIEGRATWEDYEEMGVSQPSKRKDYRTTDAAVKNHRAAKRRKRSKRAG